MLLDHTCSQEVRVTSMACDTLSPHTPCHLQTRRLTFLSFQVVFRKPKSAVIPPHGLPSPASLPPWALGTRDPHALPPPKPFLRPTVPFPPLYLPLPHASFQPSSGDPALRRAPVINTSHQPSSWPKPKTERSGRVREWCVQARVTRRRPLQLSR